MSDLFVELAGPQGLTLARARATRARALRARATRARRALFGQRPLRGLNSECKVKFFGVHLIV
jgi:hypothetical protein